MSETVSQARAPQAPGAATSPPPALRMLAGHGARRHVERQGLSPDDVGVLPGASGGPKWLVLYGLDRYLFGEWLAQGTRPVELPASSIGAWRFAAALSDQTEFFLEGYLGQRYSEKPSAAEVSAVAEAMVARLLPADRALAVCQHRRYRLGILIARARGPVARDDRSVLGPALLTLAGLNLLHPSLLQVGFARHLVARRETPDALFHRQGWRTGRSELSADNLGASLLATGSIPMVLEGVASPPGTPRGIYRDGGITDYHLPLDFAGAPGLTLYPHFGPVFKPGWFDKHLPWRRMPPRSVENTLALVPSEATIADLPGGRVPDRRDFLDYDDDERLRVWQRGIDAGRRMADEFAEWIAAGTPADRLEPFPAA